MQLQDPELYDVSFDPRNSSALIYSLGKVASTTIWVTVSLAVGYYQYAVELQNTYKPILKTHVEMVAKDFIDKDKSDQPIWVFTSVRQPFTRLISMYFEDIEMERYSSRNRTLAMTMPEMHDDFLEWYKVFHPTREETWFANELHRVTGANLSAYTFPVEEGRLVVKSSSRGKRFIVVVLRFEDIMRWNQTMKAQVWWWGMHDIHKQNSKEVWYHEKYRDFARSFRWPEDRAQELLECEQFRLYSPAEREAFYKHAVGETPATLGNGVLQTMADGRQQVLYAFGGSD